MKKGGPTGSRVAVTRFAFTAALGGFLFGYDSAVINGAVTAIGDHYRVSAGALGFTVSSALLGAAVGAVLAGRVADRFGRLKVMWLAAVMFLISALGAGLGGHTRVADRVPGDRWGRCRHGLGDRPCVYRRDRTGAHARSTRIGAAAGDRAGHLHRAAGRLRARDGGGRLRTRVWRSAWRRGAGCSWRWRCRPCSTACWR